jgi:hypothetical protein
MMESNKYEKAILDIIAYAEGTMLTGENNGYDILFGDYTIVGWTKDTTINHRCVVSQGCVDKSWRQYGGKNKSGEDVYTTAAGRYQVIGPTWAKTTKDLKLGENAPMTTKNQDLVAIKLLKGRGVTQQILEDASKSLEGFKVLSTKIQDEWEAFKRSLNNDKGIKSQDVLFQRYKEALSKY